MKKDPYIKQNPVIFTDLDGTLLDFNSYSLKESREAVQQLLDRDIPIVFCSSKTRSEQRAYQKRLNIHAPFIVENGSAVFIPKGYFDFSYPFQRATSHYHVIELGVMAERIQQILSEIRDTQQIPLKGYRDLSLADLCQWTGLSPEDGQRASEREYSETLVSTFSPEQQTRLETALAQHDLAGVSGGRFYTVTSLNSDKGKAVILLAALFRKRYQSLYTIGIGDNKNDIPLLSAVDQAFLVQKPDQSWEDISAPQLQKITGIGPRGWKRAMAEILS